MACADKTIEVDVPVQTVYDKWTQFEDFPRFMEGVQEIQQMSDEVDMRPGAWLGEIIHGDGG